MAGSVRVVFALVLLVFVGGGVAQFGSDEGCCAKAGLPRRAEEYYLLNGLSPVHGERVAICIDQGGSTCHYPIEVMVGVNEPNGTILEYLLVDNSTNFVHLGCKSNCNAGAGAGCPNYQYPNGFPEVYFYWNAINFDPVSLTVQGLDARFSYSEGCFIYFNVPVLYHGWGATENCDLSFLSEFMVDLSGGPFVFNDTAFGWTTYGATPQYTFKTDTATTKYVTGLGYCASITPIRAGNSSTMCQCQNESTPTQNIGLPGSNNIQLAIAPTAPIFQL